MKRAKYIFPVLAIIIILVVWFLSNKEGAVFSEQLIYGKPGEIDLVQIDYKQESSTQLQDSATIKQLVKKLQGIELRPLSPEEEIKLYKEKELLYSIVLTSVQGSKLGEEAIGGAAIVFSTGEIVFPDIKTMGDGRTVSYINVNEEDAKIESITTFLQSLVK